MNFTESEKKIMKEQLESEIDKIAMKKMNEYLQHKYRCNKHKDLEHHTGECQYIGTIGERYDVYKKFKELLSKNYTNKITEKNKNHI